MTWSPSKAAPNNPPIGFLVQSGFPEGAHSRFVERYLEKLAARLGSPYLGTIVRGGGEGTRLMPDKMNRKLFDALQALGRGFAVQGRLDPACCARPSASSATRASSSPSSSFSPKPTCSPSTGTGN